MRISVIGAGYVGLVAGTCFVVRDLCPATGGDFERRNTRPLAAPADRLSPVTAAPADETLVDLKLGKAHAPGPRPDAERELLRPLPPREHEANTIGIVLCPRKTT